jgi:hypothetical protein
LKLPTQMCPTKKIDRNRRRGIPQTKKCAAPKA